MNKKLFTILFIAVFLIASVGFVSAVDDSKDISVKITDNNQNHFADTTLGDIADDIDSNDDNPTNGDDSIADDNENETDDEDDETSDDTEIDDDIEGSDDSPLVISTGPEKQVVKKEFKKEPQKAELKNTGLPVAGLVLVAFGAAFIPFARKRR